MKQKGKPLTVADVIRELKKLPPKMEVWCTWDESGECWPRTEAHLKPHRYGVAWLQATLVGMHGKRKRYEELVPGIACDDKRIKRNKSVRKVVIL